MPRSENRCGACLCISGPGRTRTCDPSIMSRVLYHLSYGPGSPVNISATWLRAQPYVANIQVRSWESLSPLTGIPQLPQQPPLTNNQSPSSAATARWPARTCEAGGFGGRGRAGSFRSVIPGCTDRGRREAARRRLPVDRGPTAGPGSGRRRGSEPVPVRSAGGTGLNEPGCEPCVVGVP